MNEFQKLFESSRRTTELLEGNDEFDVIDIGDAHWDAIKTVQKAHPGISIEYDQQGGSAGDSYFNKFTIYNGSEESIGSVRVGDSSLSGMSEEEIKDYFVSALEDELKSVKSKKKKNKKARGVFVYDGTQKVPEDVTEVVVKEGVKEIGDEAFSYCLQLKSVTIPNSVTSIGYGAFIECNRLTNITIPSSVTTIAPNAFVRCESLENITIPDSVTSIGKSAFSCCTGLKSITIPDSVTSIGAYAFRDCTSLTNITIPDGVTSIGKHAFNGCTGLTSITISDSVTEIGSWAFYNCTGITSVTIPDSVTAIGSFAFYNCKVLTDVYYTGSESQWNKIDIGRSNEALKNVKFNCAKSKKEAAFQELFESSHRVTEDLVGTRLQNLPHWPEAEAVIIQINSLYSELSGFSASVSKWYPVNDSCFILAMRQYFDLGFSYLTDYQRTSEKELQLSYESTEAEIRDYVNRMLISLRSRINQSVTYYLSSDMTRFYTNEALGGLLIDEIIEQASIANDQVARSFVRDTIGKYADMTLQEITDEGKTNRGEMVESVSYKKESKSAKHVHRIVKESVFGKDIHGNSITAKSLEGGSVEELISLYPDIKFTVVGNGSMADCITKVSNGHYRILTDDPEVNPDLAYIRGYKASAEEITQFKDTVRSSLIKFFNRYRMTQVSEQQVDDIIETALQKHLLPGGWVLKNLSAVVPRITKSARDAGEVWIYFGFKRVGTEERIPVDFPLKVTRY